MMVMNIRWGQPNNLMYLYMGGDEAPVWWADYPNLARGLPPNGMLHRCTNSNTCPQILETFGSADSIPKSSRQACAASLVLRTFRCLRMSIGTTRAWRWRWQLHLGCPRYRGHTGRSVASQ
jgi:hypothetical protein